MDVEDLVTLPRLVEIYTELEGLRVPLDDDPMEYGPQRVSNKVAKIRSCLDRVDEIFGRVSQDMHWIKRKLIELEGVLELQKNHLMVNDTSVRAGRSQSEREAIAYTKLSEDVKTIQKLKMMISDLEQVMVVIKAKRADLKDTQSQLRTQIKLIDQEIGLGRRWGQEMPKPDAQEAKRDFTNILDAIDSENSWSE